MLSLIALPAGATADMVANVGTLFSDLWLLIVAVVGIPFAFYIVRKVIALVPKGR